MRHLTVFSLFCLSSIPLFSAESVTVGIMKETIKGNGKVNVCSTPFVPSATQVLTAGSVSGNTVTVTASSASPTGISPLGSYYAEILTSDGVKEISAISAVSSTTITLASATNVQAGDTLFIRPYLTLDTLLGSANTFNFRASSTGNPAVADTVMILDSAGQTFSSYFYSTLTGFVGWYNATSFEPAGSTRIEPGSGIIFRMVGPDVTLYFSGEVQTSPVETRINHGINLVGVMNPLAGNYAGRMLTLTGSGLYSGSDSDGIKPSADGNTAIADWVYLFSPANQTLATHFYSTLTDYVGWYDATSFQTSGTSVLEAGTAFYLFRRGQAFYWTQPVNYLNN
jgi:hypothetical protein